MTILQPGDVGAAPGSPSDEPGGRLRFAVTVSAGGNGSGEGVCQREAAVMLNKDSIETIIEQALRNKLANYNPEMAHMPFRTGLLEKDRMALYSFIHPLFTNFGTAIFERIALEIARREFDEVILQRQLSGELSSGAQEAITGIMDVLSAGMAWPNHRAEMAKLLEVARSGRKVTKRMRKVDIYLAKGNDRFLIDLKTAKPNIKSFRKYKQDMLEWAASLLYQDPNANVRIIVGIPYNPYEPEPYRRWKMCGMLEIENQSQLMVGPELWNFLAGGDIYQSLLDCFEAVGYRMRDEIDRYFNGLEQQRYS